MDHGDSLDLGAVGVYRMAAPIKDVVVDDGLYRKHIKQGYLAGVSPPPHFRHVAQSGGVGPNTINSARMLAFDK